MSYKLSAIKSGLIHNFLHLKMHVPFQVYDSCVHFCDVFYPSVLPFDKGLFVLNFPRSGILFILLLRVIFGQYLHATTRHR